MIYCTKVRCCAIDGMRVQQQAQKMDPVFASACKHRVQPRVTVSAQEPKRFGGHMRVAATIISQDIWGSRIITTLTLPIVSGDEA